MPKIISINKISGSKPTISEKSQNSEIVGSDESIVSATYTDPETGDVSEGDSHLDANPNAPKDEVDRETKEYGFKTSKGRVVSRKEAYGIARKAKQLKSLHPKQILHTKNLKHLTKLNKRKK